MDTSIIHLQMEQGLQPTAPMKMNGSYKPQIRGKKPKFEQNTEWHSYISFVTCRGSTYANAKGNNEQVACPSDVTEWQFWYDGWQDGGENIRLSCANSIGEICVC